MTYGIEQRCTSLRGPLMHVKYCASFYRQRDTRSILIGLSTHLPVSLST